MERTFGGVKWLVGKILEEVHRALLFGKLLYSDLGVDSNNAFPQGLKPDNFLRRFRHD
jgi:hypothetical protein